MLTKEENNNHLSPRPSSRLQVLQAAAAGALLLITATALVLAAVAFYEVRGLRERVTKLEQRCPTGAAEVAGPEVKVEGAVNRASNELEYAVVAGSQARMRREIRTQNFESGIIDAISRQKRGGKGNRDSKEQEGKKDKCRKKCKGEKGEQGLPGIDGAIGEKGERGEKGEKGDSFTMVAAHFQGSFEKAISSGVEYGRNPREIQVPDGKLRWWKKADWMNDNQHFILNADGDITVLEEGYYFIYSQVLYYDNHPLMGHRVVINHDWVILSCMEHLGDGSNPVQNNTCYVGGIVHLWANSQVSVDMATLPSHPDPSIYLTPSNVYIGFIKLS